MKKINLLTLSGILLSHSTFATNNVEPISFAEFPSLVTNEYCMGTLLAGNWVMIGAFCPGDYVEYVHDENGVRTKDRINITRVLQPRGGRLELWQLEKVPQVDKVIFLSNNFISNNVLQRFDTFGVGPTEMKLYSVELKVDGDMSTRDVLNLNQITDIEKGVNYGAPVVNRQNNKIVAISTPFVHRPTAHTRINHHADFILASIDAWHHQTSGSIEAGQSMIIEVQSLHRSPVLDNTISTGDIAIDANNSSCMIGLIEPFDVCSYTITSHNGNEGELVLSPNQKITFNGGKFTPVLVAPVGANANSHGGALGFWGLLGLALTIFLRKLKFSNVY